MSTLSSLSSRRLRPVITDTGSSCSGGERARVQWRGEREVQAWRTRFFDAAASNPPLHQPAPAPPASQAGAAQRRVQAAAAARPTHILRVLLAQHVQRLHQLVHQLGAPRLQAPLRALLSLVQVELHSLGWVGGRGGRAAHTGVSSERGAAGRRVGQAVPVRCMAWWRCVRGSSGRSQRASLARQHRAQHSAWQHPAARAPADNHLPPPFCTPTSTHLLLLLLQLHRLCDRALALNHFELLRHRLALRLALLPPLLHLFNLLLRWGITGREGVLGRNKLGGRAASQHRQQDATHKQQPQTTAELRAALHSTRPRPPLSPGARPGAAPRRPPSFP